LETAEQIALLLGTRPSPMLIDKTAPGRKAMLSLPSRSLRRE
jgi:hypothetical protein